LQATVVAGAVECLLALATIDEGLKISSVGSLMLKYRLSRFGTINFDEVGPWFGPDTESLLRCTPDYSVTFLRLPPSKMDFNGLLGTLPKTSFSFAYGSGVFEQAGYENVKEAPMIDMVMATPNAAQWHSDNLALNRHHYSLLGSLGGTGLARIQEDMGAGIYYNSLVPIPTGVKGAKPGQMFKYGVISTHTLIDDLVNWRSMYVSGRMHKPVRIIECDDPVILAAARENLRHALRCALLLLPPTFTAEELFTVSIHGAISIACSQPFLSFYPPFRLLDSFPRRQSRVSPTRATSGWSLARIQTK
jgi:Phosphatidate cytidylyltransferase, mitochondrial